MSSVIVSYQGKMSFLAKNGNHSFAIDLAQEKGGDDLAMAPPEVFMASLAACAGVYVAKYCQNAIKSDPNCGLDLSQMSVAADYKISEDKTSISEICLTLSLPNAKLENRDKAVLLAAERCLIHNTLLKQPKVRIVLEKKA